MSKHLPQKESRHLKAPEVKRPRRTARETRATVREHPAFDLTKKNIAVTAGAALLFTGALIAGFTGWLGAAVYAVPLVLAGIAVAMRAVEEAFGGNYLEESIFVIVASAAAYATGQFAAGAGVMVLYRAGKLLDAAAAALDKKMYAGMKMRLPQSINICGERGIEEKQPQQAAVDDEFIVQPGEMLALDGVVVEGMSALDASALTGSADNFTVAVGSRVMSGCINVSAPIRVRAEKIFADSTASRVCDALEGAHKFRADLEKRIERFAGIYTPVLVGLGLVSAVIPPIFTGAWKDWISRGTVLLVLSGTSALSVAAALSYVGAVAVSAKNGIIVKGTRFVEALAKAKTMIFNKTGTLTEGRYAVLDVVPHGVSENELLYAAAMAEQYSRHPIARAICASCGGFEREARSAVKMEEIPGRGVSTVVQGKHIFVGNAALLEEHSIHCEIPRRGGAAMHVAVNGAYCGYIVVSDRVREGAFDAIEELRVLGVRNTVLLTDDIRSVARPVASALNFEMVKSEQTPESKISAVEYLIATKPERSTLAVVCDRAGDAQALERADVGISIAALDSEAAFESADILIMADDLRLVPAAVRIAKRAYDAAVQNTAAFSALRLLMIILALCGVLPILAAAVTDFLASALIFINTYRTLGRQGHTRF